MSRKRRRDLPAVDTQLVEIYDDLANEDEEIRLKAAQSLLQKASPSAGLTSEKLNEVLRRLIRGLCSGRKAARLGFSVALTEYLIQLLGPDSSYTSPPTTLHEVFKVLEEQTHIGSNVGGQVQQDANSVRRYPHPLTRELLRRRETIILGGFLEQKP